MALCVRGRGIHGVHNAKHHRGQPGVAPDQGRAAKAMFRVGESGQTEAIRLASPPVTMSVCDVTAGTARAAVRATAEGTDQNDLAYAPRLRQPDQGPAARA